MFHLAAYTMALGTTVDTDVPFLTEEVLQSQNNHIVLGQPMQLMAAFAASPLLDRVKLASPSMRQLVAPWVRPIHNGLTGPTNPNMLLLDHNPFRIEANEEIAMQATSTIGAMTERFWALLWLQISQESIPVGNVVPLRWTSTTAAVANTWSTLSISFADTLPAGVYSVVNTEHISTNAQAHRLVFSNQMWRPGMLSFTTSIMRHPYAVSKGQFGKFGQFRSNDLPRVQVLCNAADATHTGYIHVVRTGILT